MVVSLHVMKIMNTDWNNIPFTPRRWPFFYGWMILAISTIGIIASIPGQTMGVGVFTDDLINVLGLSRLRLSTAYMFGTIGSSLLLPLAGTVMDRIGLRAMMACSALGLGLSLVAFSHCDCLVGFGDGSTTWLPFITIIVCYLLIRFFGQGCLTMSGRVAIGKWFNHRRGLATGISTVFVSFGFNASPRLLNYLVDSYGWRNASLLLAVVVGGVMTVLGWCFHRDNPEDCGLSMDGVDDENWHREMEKKVPPVKHDFTRSQALRTLGFWAFNLAHSSQVLIMTAIVFHITSLGREKGLDETQSFKLFLPMAFFSVGASFLGGWISDRLHLKWLLIVMLLFQAIMLLGLTKLDVLVGKWSFIVAYGISVGLFATLSTVVWPRFFGRTHLGSISGANMSSMVFASAIGPVAFSAGQKLTGSYHAVMLICLVMPLVLCLVALKVRNPQEMVEADMA